MSRFGPQPVGMTVLVTGSSVKVKQSPTMDEVAAASVVYLGGHEYEISQAEADVLTAAGLVVG